MYSTLWLSHVGIYDPGAQGMFLYTPLWLIRLQCYYYTRTIPFYIWLTFFLVDVSTTVRSIKCRNDDGLFKVPEMHRFCGYTQLVSQALQLELILAWLLTSFFLFFFFAVLLCCAASGIRRKRIRCAKLAFHAQSTSSLLPIPAQ